MRLLLQILFYCFLFWLPVRCTVKNSGRNCLYFYPKEFLEEAQRRGLADRDAVMKQGKKFMIPYCVYLAAVLVLILGLWNRVTVFRTAYFQACLFLVAVNWFDGIVMDRLWVGRSRIWAVEGMEGVLYLKPWKTVLEKRGAATVLYLILAAPIAGLAVLVGRICSAGG